MSHGPSIRYRKITKSDFRPCSTCRSHSQAPLCLYALQMISNHFEGTFERLRYSLGGDRPSQTAHQTLSLAIHLQRLETKNNKGGIPRLTPKKLASFNHSLPPILYILFPISILSCSKAPWGLFVLSRVTGIFTGNLISPRLLLRQRPNRYAFRAGRNLPDKEFRYLRTVIVTAAVYWDFNSMLRCLTSPFNLPAPGRHQPLYITLRFSRDLCF
ncbi:hypothetical protein SLY_1106 [Strawberry lethal yellows phytoplasma (CPA) str. NZSb11]|uniref:Uncharacterized protein n=1 Tax=Strawberry lethal yellows phytoplasma (CPA) str. NZSb11 TaxID=980422 RepID=R4RPK2_PHYAS|nr:hypothetical protein SLY_0486 [Strawberry lethal yellows phytoplasma (CPA) str. NZSb11]AGL91012.1 hypothetical protein SLY_1106 [Strawberry lethal yellows phytoplasma (CPA) str. NZSb11]